MVLRLILPETCAMNRSLDALSRCAVSFLLVTLWAAASCKNDGSNPALPTQPPPVPGIASISVALPPGSFAIGQSVHATAVARDVNGVTVAIATFSWSSSNQAVAAVSTSGIVTAVGAGAAVISASSGSTVGSAPVSVVAPPVSLAFGTIYVSDNREAFVGGPRTLEISTIDPGSGELTNLTKSPAAESRPIPSPDGQLILIIHNGIPTVVRKDATSPTGMPWACKPFTNCIGAFNGWAYNKGSAWDNSGVTWLRDGRIRFLVSDEGPVGVFTDALVTYAPPNGAIVVSPVHHSLLSALGARAVSSPNPDLEVFSRDGGLYSYRLSTGAVSTIAPPCAFVTTCVTPPIWSPDASKLYAIREAAIWEYAVGGGQGRKLYSAAQLSELTLSPDGQYLAFIEYESVRVLSTGTGSLTPATVFYGSAFNNAEEYLAWSPDSKSLVMLILQNPRYYLYGVNRDGTGMKELARVAGVSGLSWGR